MPHSKLIQALTLCAMAGCLTVPPANAQFGTPQLLYVPEDPGPGNSLSFGSHLAIDRDTLAVFDGAQQRLWVYGRQADPSRWELVDEPWVPKHRATAGGGTYIRLALQDDIMVLGEPLWGQRRIGEGIAFLYRREPGANGRWRLVRRLQPKLAAGANFGAAVAIDGDRIAIGAVGVGRVFLYERWGPAPGRWGLAKVLQGETTDELTRLRLEDPAEPTPGFGRWVALTGNLLAVGSEHPGPDAQGKYGAGLGVYLLERQTTPGNSWLQVGNIGDPGRPLPHRYSRFGRDLAAHGGLVVAGKATTGGSQYYLYERRADGSWQRKTRLRTSARGGQAALRGNTAVLASNDDALVFERHENGRDRWSVIGRLRPSFGPGDIQGPIWNDVSAVGIGPREIVIGHDARRIVQVYPRAPIHDDDFESGGTDAWGTSAGSVTAVRPGLDGSGHALEVRLNGIQRNYVRTSRPMREPTISLRFWLLANAVELGNQRVEILSLKSGNPLESNLRLLLENNMSAASHVVRLQARELGGAWRLVGTAEIAPGQEAEVGVEWIAANGPGARDGRARLLLDRHVAAEARNLDTPGFFVSTLDLGLPEGAPGVNGGSFLVDGFELHR